MSHYWYETQERAFAPGIVRDWPDVIRQPRKLPHGRLVRRDGDPRQWKAERDDLLDALRAFCGDYEATPTTSDTSLKAAYLHALTVIAKAEGHSDVR